MRDTLDDIGKRVCWAYWVPSSRKYKERTISRMMCKTLREEERVADLANSLLNYYENKKLGKLKQRTIWMEHSRRE